MPHSSTSSSDLKRYLGRSAVFAALFLTLAVVMRWRAPLWFGNDTLHAKWHHLQSQPAGTFNHLIIGSSRILCHIRPLQLDSMCAQEGLDLRTYNLGAPATFAPQTLNVLDEVLDQAVPGELELITMELSFPNPNKEHRQQHYSHFWDVENFVLAANFLRHRAMPLRQKAKVMSLLLKDFLSAQLLLGQTRILHFFLSPTSLSVYPHHAYAATRGYLSLQSEFERQGPKGAWAGRADLLAQTHLMDDRRDNNIKVCNATPLRRINTFYLDFLKERIETARSKGIYLMFILPAPDVANLEMISFAHQMPPDHFMNFSSPEEFPHLYVLENQFDLGHLNNAGGELFTADVARSLAEILAASPAFPVASPELLIDHPASSSLR